MAGAAGMGSAAAGVAAAPRAHIIVGTPAAVLIAVGFIVAGVITDTAIHAHTGDRARGQ